MAKIDKLTQEAKGHLEPGEEIVAVVLGTYEAKLMGNNTLRTGIFIATNKRVVFYAKRMFGYDLEVFPYSNISSIEMSKGFTGHTISLFASGNKVHMKWITTGEIQKFVDYIKGNIGKKQASEAQGASQSNIPEQIKQLAELKEEGILTEEEFQSKKKELLAKLG